MKETDSDKLNIKLKDTVNADAEKNFSNFVETDNDVKTSFEKNTDSMGGLNLFLPIGMLFQFFFTVFGAGMLIAGIITACNISKSKSGIENLDKICVLLIIIGAVMFMAGVIVSVFMLFVVKNNNFQNNKENITERNEENNTKSNVENSTSNNTEAENIKEEI